MLLFLVATARAGEPAAYPELTFHAEPKALGATAITEDWPGLLGPRRDGSSRETRLLKSFPPGSPKLVWEMTRGSGYASPAVAAGRLVFFHRLADEESVDCLQAETGKRYWRVTYPTRYEDRYEFSNGPRCTPYIDGDRVFTLGVEGKLHCLDLESGKTRWKIDLREKYGIKLGFFGVGSTPIVEGDKLIVSIGAEGGPCVVAFDKNTGDVVWKAGDQWGMSYASPMVTEVFGERRLFVFAGGERDPSVGGLLVIDPANGKIETRYPFRGKRYESINAANPVVFDNNVFLTTSYGTGSVLLKLKFGGGFDLAWKSKHLVSHFPTPLYLDGHLYGLDGFSKHGTGLTCLNAKTGDMLWHSEASWKDTIGKGDEARDIPAGIFRGSLLHADGHILALGEDGHLLWLDLSPTGYRELARTSLFRATGTWTPPALSRGLLFVPQNQKDTVSGKPSRLLCYDLRGS